MGFTKRDPYKLLGNPFQMYDKEWALATAGDGEKINTMTISWGGLGILWNKPVAFTYIRPQRYTREFVDAQEAFSISFLGEGNLRKELALLGSKSGRDGDKIAEAGLVPIMLDGVPAFEEARLVLVCHKLYRQDMREECFLEKELVPKHYPAKDFHTQYIAEITAVYEK